jgi:hypothetical protein
MNDKTKISNAFKNLRKNGWFARMSFWCCQSCGCAAVPEGFNNKFVFYHKQDAEAFDREGNLGGKNKRTMYLTHGEGGDANEIVKALNNHGLNTDWNGDMNIRIMVKHKD